MKVEMPPRRVTDTWLQDRRDCPFVTYCRYPIAFPCVRYNLIFLDILVARVLLQNREKKYP